MFYSLMKHQLTRPSAFALTRVASASLTGKVPPNVRTSEEFFVTATWPDDDSSFKSDVFDGQARTITSQTSPMQFSAAEIERHKADIYDSIFPKDPSRFLKRQNSNNLPDQEPSLDEL
ncbi:Uncharacterized protein PECH_006631 [Penicillium ucsense]|uniref:Uncharacterized protein n=1 Tax=Penicillium ucsense TaxID=2839758 RepID=A0A8J8VXR8_9EURO|nr:Uncharacterized protein PECM_000664 [Penicillium ucsense]KAF7735428.1 Uncharacterized protein PECH_006631 [Penicillium ucsense]